MLDTDCFAEYYSHTMKMVGEYEVPERCDCGPVRNLIEHAAGIENAKRERTDEAFDPATIQYVADRLHEVGGLSEADARIMAHDEHGNYLKLVAEELDALDEELATTESICKKLTGECPGRLRVATTDALGRKIVLYVCSSPLIDALDKSDVEPVIVERIN